MKKRFLALCLLMALPCYAEQDAPPDEPSNLFFDTDIFLYEPKFTLSFGVRGLGGLKSSFVGSGRIQSVQDFGDPTGSGVARTYHDGAVDPDQRTITVDDGNGGATQVPITPDGLTNSWGFGDAKQIQPDNTIAMHAYSAETVDGGPREKNAGSAFGVEVALARDMGKLVARLDWNIAAGVSINDISSKLTAQERSDITTVTDFYSLNGAPAPTPPYSSPSNVTVPVLDSNGNPVLNADGTQATTQADATVLLSDQPQSRTKTTTQDTTSVTNHYHLKGAYFTARVGPTIILPVTTNLRATLSFGAALVYAGTTYDVDQQFQPDTGPVIDDDVSNTTSRFLPGYFVDASMDYFLTNRTGFYLGAVYQSSGDYRQSVNTDSAYYTTHVDLSSLQGFRMGVNFKF